MTRMTQRQVLEGKQDVEREKAEDAGDKDEPWTEASDNGRESDELNDMVLYEKMKLTRVGTKE